MSTNLSASEVLMIISNTNGGSGPDPAGQIHAALALRHDHLPDSIMPSIDAPTSHGGRFTQPMISVDVIFIAGVVALCIYSTIQFLRPFVSLYGHLRRARAIGLPMKVIPFPPGLFSFFVFQVLRQLGLLEPGTKLHRLLSMGRPDGYDLHKEMGDVFVTVSPAGLTLIVADPKVVTYVNSKRAEFPKPPNTGAIINIYGRNVINADGEVWRFHRRVTGPAFSERIHRAVWQESMNQARCMMQSWLTSSECKADSISIPSIGDDTLHLGLNVITGAAYGCPLAWNESPPCASPINLSYRASVEQLTAHLMPIFLTPRWLLRLAPRDSTWGRAWEAYSAFGGYMRGMLDRERAHMNAGECTEENLLTALIRAEELQDEKESRKMDVQEVMGNAFIFLFAGHETTANTLHYALLLLAQHPDVQQSLLNEIDDVYDLAAREGRSQLQYELDFNRARWTFAIMSETLRMYTPTGMTNKWTATDQPIAFEGHTYVIPQGTRISINGTGVHSNPKVWGEDATKWEPSRWIVEGGDGNAPLVTPQPTPRPSRAPSPSPEMRRRSIEVPKKDSDGRPPSPSALLLSPFAAQLQQGSKRRRTSSRSSSTGSAIVSGTTSPHGILKPAKGTFLPFSEGSRACSGKKFATVEFVAVVFTLLREHRVELAEGWSVERVQKVLSGRKAGALTLQPPESIPLKFIRR